MKVGHVTAVEEMAAVIPAGTERQAMDWSLVLVSQGIGVTVDREPHGTWLLRVAPGELSRARDAIRQFRRENRGFEWRHELPGSGLLFDARVFFWALVVALVYWIQDRLDAGLFDTRAVRTGDWWRSITAVWMHRDAAHLASNLSLGVAFLGLAMARFGVGVALLGSLAAGALANLTAMALRPAPYTGLGASGMIMGALGMLAAQSLPWWRSGRRGVRMILAGLGAGVLMFIMTGTREESDVLAHAGGFVFGMLFGGLASLVPSPQSRAISAGTLAAFAGVVGLAWFLALR